MKNALVARALDAVFRQVRPAAFRHHLSYAIAGGLLGFALSFLPHLLTDPCAPFHQDLCGWLDRAAEPGGRLIGALPREHAKTTLGTVALTLRELCLGDKRNILLVAANREEAQVKLRQIVTEIETNPHLPPEWRTRLAPARDAKGHRVAYADGEIVLAGGARIGALGFGGKVRGQLSGGRRLDLVILDDPEDDSAVASPERRRKLRRWVDCALLNALDARRGSLVWLGTLLHHDSVLAQWMALHEQQPASTGRGPGRRRWQVVRKAALSEAGEPLWPSRWTRERLEQRRAEIGDAAFAQEYLNRPLSLSGQVFRPGEFRHYDPAQLERHGGEWHLEREMLTVAIGVDPAIGDAARHDYFAACVVGVTQTAGREQSGRICVLDVVRRRARFEKQLGVLALLAGRWCPRLIGIESVAYQAALSQAAWDRGLPVVALSEQRPKAVRIEAAAVHAARGHVFLPVAADWVAEFRQEAGDYPAGRHDDQLDAFARAVEVALSLAGGGEVLPAEERRGRGAAVAFGRPHTGWLKGF